MEVLWGIKFHAVRVKISNLLIGVKSVVRQFRHFLLSAANKLMDYDWITESHQTHASIWKSISRILFPKVWKQ